MDTKYVVKLPSDNYILDKDTRLPRVFSKDEAVEFCKDKPWCQIVEINN